MRCRRLRGPGKAAVGATVVAVVAGGVAVHRDSRPCGWGGSSPEGAVSGVLAALEQQDERRLCRTVAADVTLPPDVTAVVRRRVLDAGGSHALTVRDLEEQQLGALHVVEAVTEQGHVVAEFQTLPGDHGTVVVQVTTTPGRW